MACEAKVELRDFKISTQIGTYAPGDCVPDQHVLDLVLWIGSDSVLIAQDAMAHVFDYDPLVCEIERLAGDGHYETQERLMTRIVGACAGYQAIQALDIYLRKSPVRTGTGTGSLGMRLYIDPQSLEAMREGGGLG